MATEEIFTRELTRIYRKNKSIIIGNKLPFTEGSLKFSFDNGRIWIYTLNDIPVLIIPMRKIQTETGQVFLSLTLLENYLNTCFNTVSTGSSTYCGFEDLGDLAGIFDSA